MLTLSSSFVRNARKHNNSAIQSLKISTDNLNKKEENSVLFLPSSFVRKVRIRQFYIVFEFSSLIF